MSATLYLDSARLGQFSDCARRALTEFFDLVGPTPTHPLLLEWLRSGVGLGKELAVLSQWRGIEAFEKSITSRFNAPDNSRALMSSRSVTLIRLGLQQLFKRCRRCMTVDTCWPRYLHELQQAATGKSDSVFVKNFRGPVYDLGISVEEWCENLCLVYCSEGCDGLFLPAVDYLGTRIPVAEIVRSIREFGGEVRFVVVDAAQGLGHVPLTDDCSVADFLVAGTHKWLGSYSTLGVGVAPKMRSSAVIKKGVQNALRDGFIDDGLLAFVEQLRGSTTIQSETVNLCPLITAFGAMEIARRPTMETVSAQLRNAQQIMRIAEQVGWNAELPDNDFRSGILLLQLPKRHRITISSADLQRIFADRSVYLTAYDQGLVRLSLPVAPLCQDSIDQLEQALSAAYRVACGHHTLIAG